MLFLTLSYIMLLNGQTLCTKGLNMDFNFPHFANFNFARFKIEESFGLIWVKLQNGRFHLQISILGI